MGYLPHQNFGGGGGKDGSNLMDLADLEGSSQFAGDFFGDYEDYDDNDFPGNFGDGAGEMEMDSTDEEQEEDEAARVDLEHGWEPPHPSAAYTTTDDDLQHHAEQTHLQHLREEVEDFFCVDPVVVLYPGERAGEIVWTNRTGFEAYKGLLDGQGH